MHLSLALECYAASREYMLAAAALLRSHFADFSLQVEGDLPPHRSAEDLCDTGRFMEEAGIPFVLEGPTLMSDPDRPGRRRVLSLPELRALRAAAPAALRAIRIHTTVPSLHRRPRQFEEVVSFCHAEGVPLALVLAPEDWAEGAWSNAVRSRRLPCELLMLHAASVSAEWQPPAFVITGIRRRLFARCGYALELSRGSPTTEEIERIIRAIKLQDVAKPSELHVYPTDALIDNRAGCLPPHQHAWPTVSPEALFPPGAELSLTPLGAAIANHLGCPS